MAGFITGMMRTMRDLSDLESAEENRATSRQTRKMRDLDFDKKKREQEDDEFIRKAGEAAYSGAVNGAGTSPISERTTLPSGSPGDGDVRTTLPAGGGEGAEERTTLPAGPNERAERTTLPAGVNTPTGSGTTLPSGVSTPTGSGTSLPDGPTQPRTPKSTERAVDTGARSFPVVSSGERPAGYGGIRTDSPVASLAGGAATPVVPGTMMPGAAGSSNRLEAYLRGVDAMTDAALRRGRMDVAGKYWADAHALRQHLLDEEMARADREFAKTGDLNSYLPAFNKFVTDAAKIVSIQPGADGSMVMQIAQPDGTMVQHAVKPEEIQGFMMVMRDPKKFADLRRQMALQRAVEIAKGEAKVLEAQGKAAAEGIKVGPNERVYLPDAQGRITKDRVLTGPSTATPFKGVQGNETNEPFVIDERTGAITPGPPGGPAAGMRPRPGGREDTRNLRLENEAADRIEGLLRSPMTGIDPASQDQVSKARAYAQKIIRDSGHRMTTGEAAEKALEQYKREKELGPRRSTAPHGVNLLTLPAR